jgi:tRNA threonylcarbamoyladenosine biosynthesis protein TsaB
MRVLALDAATEACSVALEIDGAVIEQTQPSGKAHSEIILRMVREVLAEAGTTLSALDGIAASIGPGAFTGVRISVAVAQGLAFGAGLPTVPVSTLEALGLQALQGSGQPVMACLDARMGEAYWGCLAADTLQGVVFAAAARVESPQQVRLPEGQPHTGIGRGFAAYPALAALPGLDLPPANALALPRARDFAHLGSLRLRQGGGVDPAQLQPLYLRDKVALTEAERSRR